MIHEGVRADNTAGATPRFGNAHRTRNDPMSQITVHKLPLPDRKESSPFARIAGLGHSNPI